ncbi:MAG: alpha/beta fold hydrolase [Sandaracinaceae bacterium]
MLRGDRRGAGDRVIVCGHAMMVDRRSLDRPRGGGLASALAASCEVLTFDVRGHGESRPGADEGASWSYDDIVQRDVPALILAARRIAEGRKVILLGHSLVAHASLIHAGLEPDRTADAIIALAPNLWTPRLEPSRPRRIMKGALLSSWARATRAMGYFDARAFRIGADAEPLPYIEQFRRMWQRDRLSSMDGAIDYEAALGRAALPVLAYSSTGDALFARPPCVAGYLACMRAARVEHRTIDDRSLDHMGFVASPRARPMWDELAKWARTI